MVAEGGDLVGAEEEGFVVEVVGIGGVKSIVGVVQLFVFVVDVCYA